MFSTNWTGGKRMNGHCVGFAIAGLLLATTTTTEPIFAQAAGGPRVGLSQVASDQAGLWERSFRKDSVAPNQWKKGMIIGAGIGAAIGLVFYAFELKLSDNGAHPEVILGSALVLGLIGGMIGSGIHKKQ
jgi:hypothetical protein